MASTIDLTGTDGTTYNLDELATTNTRTSTDALKVQVWKWNPNFSTENIHSKPNPPLTLATDLGRIWLSKLDLTYTEAEANADDAASEV